MKGSRLEVLVESLANSGDGVGRTQNKVVFVPFACPGDRLLIEITKDKKTFALGKIIEILEPSSERKAPECPSFGRCGGCQWQHVKYETQLQWKRQNLVDSLVRIGEIEEANALTKSTQGANQRFGYRNRIQLHFDKKGPFYFEKGSKRPCHISNCPLADEKINNWLKKPDPLKGKFELALGDNSKIDLYSVTDKGQSELGFRQVNNEQNQFIANEIQKFLADKSIQKVADLYCGQGNWSLKLAENNPTLQCVGVDINPTNIKIAKQQAGPNTRFFEGDVFKLKELWEQHSDLIIIDPPRAGCSPETLQQLNEISIQWLIYISCHPATMARDLKTLTKQSWSIESITPVDMFPQTSHLECLTILRSANWLKTANP